MGKKLRSIWQVLAVIAALAVVLAVAPAIGQEESSTDGEELHLHIGTDGKYFRHVAADGGEISTQPLPEPDRCELRDVDGDLAALTANNRGVGIFEISIGVKSTGAQGTPCGRVDGNDRLTLTLGDGLIADSGELDLELKGNAHVVIELFLHGTQVGDTFEVISGTSGSSEASVTLTPDSTAGSCRGASDSGPDSGSNDNCRVILQPGVMFNGIELSVEQGEMSLEGSGDFGNDPSEDTIFHLVDWDGTIECGQMVEPPQGEDQIAEITRLQYGECDPKLYRLRADREDEQAGSVIFEFEDVDQPALYKAELTFQYDLENDVPLVGVLEYDPEPPYDDEDFEQMPACEGEFDENDPKPDIIPDGHDGCVIEATQRWDGTTVWTAVFYGDWKFR